MQNDYPLAPEKLEITLSKYGSTIADEHGIKIGDIDKLVTNLGNKGKYVLHYKYLCCICH